MTEIILNCEQVRKSYQLPQGGLLEVLRGVSFRVGQGETLAIMGRSGGGKSTLLTCLAGLAKVDSGKIELLRRDMTLFESNDLNSFRARHLGIIFQQFQLLYNFNALENVRLPLDLAGGNPKENDAIAIDKLERVGLKDRLRNFPGQLSRGECQRVALARVLAMRVPLVYADEPTGSLDLKTGGLVMDLLFETLNETKASLVLVTHDPDLAKRCGRTLQLENGVLR